MYLLNIDAQKTSETFTGCLSFIFKMIQEVLDAKLQADSLKSLILSNENAGICLLERVYKNLKTSQIAFFLSLR